MAEKTLSLPFSIDSYGKVAVTQEQPKIWADRVRSVLGTALRERVMRPTFGTVIPFALFETETQATSEIRVEVNRAFVEQLPLLKLDNVNITYDQYSNVLTIEVIYALPNNEVVSTVVGLVLVDGANPIYQELL
jgi:phage baseplate assembly protein W